MSEIYPANPVIRLLDTVVPKANVADQTNPVVAKLAQLPGFGWHTCTPQHAGQKLRSSLSHISVPTLVQHVANAKRQADQALIELIDGELPVWLRAPKYVYDVERMIQLMEQIVATFNFLAAILKQEIALANAFCAEGIAFANYIKSTLAPDSLRIQAERELSTAMDVAVTSINQQINENNASIACLI
jgi:hypothetical protein